MTPDVDIDLGQLLGAGTLTVFVMDYLKRSKWFPWISNNTELLNHIVSVVIAVFTATGIKIVSTGSIITGGVLTITFPAISVIINTLIHASGQFGWQELLHRAMGNHVMNNKILELLSAMNNQPPTPAIGAAK